MSDNSDISYPEILPANDLTDQIGDDMVQAFQLETNAVRGRSARLGKALDGILSAHEYPPEVAGLVGEVMTLTVLLSSMLKFDGIFTLQIKGDGPVNMLVSDMTSDGALRGCATFDEQALTHVEAKPGDDDFLKRIIGKGYLAFTVDQAGQDRYQGIVELQAGSLIDCVRHYFEQSEQITTVLKLAVGQRDQKWRGAGLMLQQVPDEGGVNGSALDADEWQRASVFLESASEDELLDPDLSSNDLLHRLYHEEGVRVYEPLNIRHECRCDEVRVCNVLTSMSEEDIRDMAVDGVISMRCEFCSFDYRFDPETLKALHE